MSHLTKSSIVDWIRPSPVAQWTVRPINEMTLGDVQPSAHRWSFPGYAYVVVYVRSEYELHIQLRTLRISETLTRLILNISCTSHDTVTREGTSTLLLRSVKISMSSSSSTIVKGRWRRATQSAIFIRNFCGVYVEPCANAVIVLQPGASTPRSHALAWRTKLLVLSSCRTRVTLIDGDLVRYW